ncbi:Na(+)/H(+) antiporter subunit F1 [Sporosarcina limicola]|uniref:Multicomponent Na+:H+ antiporter subunit F n=1 Tax=Sporosarcina limicola TaxID=34101 RepID=A0A927MNI2_9BACL|nr:Na(+)/H(+) antiporter subunit F1 [Sporosarcina limicola]MBE1556372.1 multicomponent Na+:H+ antiporter subunit F [Sporosarcina limicola]
MITFIWICLVLVILSMMGLLYRVFCGPSIPDRLIALDAIGVMIISATALLSILFATRFFIEVILLIAIISFIGTVSFSKFIEKGEIIERDRTSK